MYCVVNVAQRIWAVKAYLLHFGSTFSVGLLISTLVELLVLGINVHGDFQELLVQEWYSSLKTPSHGRFVGT